MGVLEVFMLALALSMDAFAASVCKGLALNKIRWKDIVIVGVWFGGFQGLMPLAGYFLGVRFADSITAVDHWIAFVLLGLIGANMIREALSKKEDNEINCSLCVKSMFFLAVATSIDALAIGVTFAFLDVNIVFSSLLIATVTFILSAVGVKIGNVFGIKYKSKAEFAGGAVLILIGGKILLEHLGVF